MLRGPMEIPLSPEKMEFMPSLNLKGLRDWKKSQKAKWQEMSSYKFQTKRAYWKVLSHDRANGLRERLESKDLGNLHQWFPKWYKIQRTLNEISIFPLVYTNAHVSSTKVWLTWFHITNSLIVSIAVTVPVASANIWFRGKKRKTKVHII